jgi:hypothetical protein
MLQSCGKKEIEIRFIHNSKVTDSWRVGKLRRGRKP